MPWRLRREEGWVATEAARTPKVYMDTVAAKRPGHAQADVLSAQDRAEERLLMGLRIADGVRWDEIAALDLGPGSAPIADLERHGLVVSGPAGLRATPDGRRLLDGVIRTLIV